MAEQTTNYNLTKPSAEDFYDVNVQNGNMDIIDENLERVDSAVSNLGKESVEMEKRLDELELETGAIEQDLAIHESVVNPHHITPTTIGLGNVPNVATNDQTPTYEEASTLTALTSGEKMSVLLGKVKKAIADLISHLSSTTKHNNGTQTGAVSIGAGASDTYNGIAIGASATGTGSTIAIGRNSYCNGGVAIGNVAKVNAGGSVGIAIGDSAEVTTWAIQLGTGTNSSPNTFQVYGHQLMNSSGKIPADRIPASFKKIITGTYVGTGTYISGQETQTNIAAAQNSIQFASYPRLVFIKRRAEDFWTMVAPNPEDNSVSFMSYGGSNSSGGLCSGEVTADYKLNWYANSQKWYYKANLTSGAVSIQLESIASGDYASLKPINQLNWSGETYDYIAICD